MRKSRVLVPILCAALTAGLSMVASSSAASSGRTVLRSSAVPFATPSRFVRAARPGRSVPFQVYLGLRQGRDAQRLLDRVSDPSSSSYTRYLSSAGFRARFAPSDADVDAVRTWLGSQGIKIEGTPLNHIWVNARASARAIDRTFGVRLGYYRSLSGIALAPDRAPSVPAALAGIVHGVNLSGIEAQHQSTPPPPAAFRVGRPCSNYWGEKIATSKPKAYGDHQPFDVCGYSPRQMQAAYGVRSAIAGGTDGSGVTVAITDAYGSPTMQSDLDTYSSKHGLPQQTITQVIDPPSPGSPGGQQRGWWSEEVLDIDAVHSMAPGAHIYYRGAANPGGALTNALADVIDHHRADIVTNSWGYTSENLSTTQIDTYHDMLVEAGDTGIGVYFSSGDCGDNVDPQGLCGGAGYRTTEYPSGDPDATSVGGTSLGVGALNDRVFELGWGTTTSNLTRHGWAPKLPGSYYYGGGGGTSRIFDQPAYQRSLVPASLSHWWGGRNRVDPDVATDGDPNTGLTIGITQRFPGGDHYGEYRLGGTSLSSPLFAGLMALADDAAGYPHGFANPALYAVAGTSAFHDIVSPKRPQALVRTNWANSVNAKDGRLFAMRTMDQTGTLHARPGYDDVTGVGSPNGSAFLAALS